MTSTELSSFFTDNLREIPDEPFLDKFSSMFVMHESVVTSYRPTFASYTAEGVCRHTGDGPFLLAAVPSLATHIARRRAIRETWGSVAYGRPRPGMIKPSHYGKPWPGMVNPLHSVRIVFVFGRPKTLEEESTLRAESNKYGDIVQAEFEDSYRNLTLKTLTILTWMTIYCPQAQHLLKVDEDTFVNVPLLLQLLAMMTSHKSRYVIGFIYTSRPSKVHRQGKWAVSPQLYPPPHYPYYTIGHSYVISGDCVRDLTLAYCHFRLIAMEDVFFTGILPKSVNISRINCRLFASRLRKAEECSLVSEDYVSETLCDAERQRLLWRQIEDGKCPESSSQDRTDRDVVKLWKPRGRQWRW